MKKFLSSVIMFCIIIFSANCSADDISYLKKFVGNWYDTNGNLLFTISEDYKFNGCTILSVGTYRDDIFRIRIDEGNRYREIQFADTYDDYHKLIVMNYYEENPIVIRKTKEPKYFESIGGIYLGMNKNQVLSIYGDPSEIKNSEWKYNREGFEVGFSFDAVSSIKIYKYGDRKFDWSGLSANNSEEDFVRKYNAKKIYDNGGYYIGNNEEIYIGEDHNCIWLEIIKDPKI